LSPRERKVLLAEAEYAVLPRGQTLAGPREAVVRAYFPDSGLIASIAEITPQRTIAVASVGAEGFIGVSRILALPRQPRHIVTLLQSRGHHLPIDTLRRAFDELEGFRAAVLAHLGRQLIEISSLVACSRLHSHRQRLARWILAMTDKVQSQRLPITHDVLAQLVGGPRPAVTVALNEFTTRGAIGRLRGTVDILNRSLLIAEACECYVQQRDLIRLNR
jgi:CRP-like cAMP-binding protein